MSKSLRKTIVFIRWAMRIISLVLVALFAVFFIGEGGLKNMSDLPSNEIILLFLIPFVFAVGTVLSFFSELWGGIVIISSVVGFNVVDIISSGGFSGIEFWYLLILGIVFIVFACLSKRRE